MYLLVEEQSTLNRLPVASQQNIGQLLTNLLIEVTYIKYDSNILGSKYALPLPLDFAPGLTIQMFFKPSMSI